VPSIIHFLPEGFQQKRQKRRATVICGIVAVVALMGMGYAVLVQHLELQQVRAARAQVDAEYAEAAKQIDQLKQLKAQKQDLLHKADLTASLLERVPRSRILAELTNALPKCTNLIPLEMKTRVKKQEAAKSKKGPARAGAGAGAKPPQQSDQHHQEIREVSFTVVGMAPTDVEVAGYISRLTGCELFKNVDLVLSEKLEYDKNLFLRRFIIKLELSPTALDEGVTAQGATSEEPADTTRPIPTGPRNRSAEQADGTNKGSRR